MPISNLQTFKLFATLSISLLLSLPADGQETDAGPDAAQQGAQQTTEEAFSPPEPALVPEGTYAIRLVQAFKLDEKLNEAQAESLLGAMDIEPKNGWIAEYPVTPGVISEIDAAVVAAADNGMLNMTHDQALQKLAEVKDDLRLSGSALSAPSHPAGSQTQQIKVYQYVDEKGGIHMTNEYEAIPEKYREQATVIGRRSY